MKKVIVKKKCCGSADGYFRNGHLHSESIHKNDFLYGHKKNKFKYAVLGHNMWHSKDNRLFLKSLYDLRKFNWIEFI